MLASRYQARSCDLGSQPAVLHDYDSRYVTGAYWCLVEDKGTYYVGTIGRKSPDSLLSASKVGSRYILLKFSMIFLETCNLDSRIAR